MMVNFKQKVLMAVMVLGVSVSAFAQRGNDNSNRRPPKDPPVVVVQPKGERPPPSNNGNQGNQDKRGDKRGRP